MRASINQREELGKMDLVWLALKRHRAPQSALHRESAQCCVGSAETEGATVREVQEHAYDQLIWESEERRKPSFSLCVGQEPAGGPRAKCGRRHAHWAWARLGYCVS